MRMLLAVLMCLLIPAAQAARYVCASSDTTNVMRDGTKELPTVTTFYVDIAKDVIRVNDGAIVWTFRIVFDGRDLSRRSVVLAYKFTGEIGTISSIVFSDGDSSFVRTVTNAYGAAVTHAVCKAVN